VVGVRLEVVAGSTLVLQVVDLVEYRDGEGSSAVTQTKGGGQRRSDDHIVVDGEWEEEVRNDETVQDESVRNGWVGAGTLPFWLAVEARRRRSTSGPQPLTYALTLTLALSMVL
jgi:hypothetical protein